MTLQTTLALAFHYLRLKALCFAVWVAFHPQAARAPTANLVADAIVTVVMADPSPIGGDDEHEAVLAARWAVEESWLRLRVTGDGGKAHGLFQLHNPAGLGSPEVQTKGWLVMLHDGARLCPESPAAPLSGGCAQARKLADRRTKAAYKVLEQFERDFDEPAAASPAAPASTEDALFRNDVFRGGAQDPRL